MKIYGFKAHIKRIDYKMGESKFVKTDAADKTIYYANALIVEFKRGRSKFETRHNITLYMEKADYENKILDIGDLIDIDDKVTLTSQQYNFNIYDPEKLKAIASKNIKTDAKGRPYAPSKILAYHIVAPIGTWLIDTKFSDLYYWQFGPLKMPMNDGDTIEECESQFKNETQYAFYLDDEEYQLVKKFEGNYVLNGYKRQTLAIKQPFNIAFEHNDELNKWKVILTKIEINGGE